MIFLTKEAFEEAVKKRIDVVMGHREQEDRYWRMMERIDSLERRLSVLESTRESTTECKVDMPFMEHG